MSIFDDEILLPGVITHVEADYSTGYDTSQFGTTDAVLVIGTAFNGPVSTPTAIYSTEHAQYVFGDAYDSTKRQEVTLLAGIQDAWDRGCRTIYGVRVGGKEMYKDFNFKVDSQYKLRLSSMYPSNTGKECYILWDGSTLDMSYYKPSERATITEKKRGISSASGSVIKTDIHFLTDRGYTKDDRLVDFINEFNSYTFNNVLKMAIVDKDGSDVTNTPEVYDLSIGALYSGAYFIGRDATSTDANIVTETKFVLVNDSNKPYSKFTGKYYRELIRNTDVSLGYPIYDESIKTLRDNLEGAGIAMLNAWDFLETTGVSDRAFIPDDVDYEETSLSNFEIYKRLGSGFAVTAQAISRGEGKKPRVKETKAEDSNHIVAIEDGIYSILQNHNAKYRVVTCVNADDDINGKLPRADEFKIAAANDVIALGGDFNITSNVDSDDLAAPHAFTIKFLSDEDINDIQLTSDNTDMNNVYRIVAQTAEPNKLDAGDFTNGTLILGTDGLLYRAGDKKVEKAIGNFTGVKLIVKNADTTKFFAFNADTSVFEEAVPDKDYILGDTLNHVFVLKNTAGALENLGDLNTYLDDDEDKLAVAASDLGAGVINEVVVRSNLYDTTTIEELADTLNSNEIFGELFTIAITTEGAKEKDEFVTDGENSAPQLGQAIEMAADRKLTYNYDKYVPYRTNDNFLRQLAQHCTYTELKTAPTHGIMGVKRLSNTSISSIASRVSEIKDKDFDLYAKNNYGRYMLESNNLPYPIGKNVSLVFGQYSTSVGRSSYTFESNGAAGYAGMVSNLDLAQSSTGQAIDLTSLTYELTNSQLGYLTEAGIVTFRTSYTNGIVVTDGITMAPAESIYRRLSTSRIVGACEELIRTAAEPYIGKENNQANRNALNTAIKSYLDKIKDTLISDYSFTMSSDDSLAKLNRIEITYQIIPIYEIREVRNTISMVDSITTNS